MESNHKEAWKYSYWLDDNYLERLKNEMQEKGMKMNCAQYCSL